MGYTWEASPGGVYKSHEMSRDLLFAAVERARFAEFVETPKFGKGKGDTLTFPRVHNLTEPDSAELAESARIPEDVFQLSTVSVTVKEYGRSVPFTSLADDLSEFDIRNAIQRKLMEQMRLVVDTTAATAFKAGKIKYIPTGPTAGTFDTDGTASTAATSNWNLFHVEEIRDYMDDTLLVDPYDGDNYMALVRTLGIRGLRRDPAWEQWHVYADPEAKAKFEVGRIEGIRFVSINHGKALAKKGTNSVLGEGVVFGDEGVALVEVQAPELRAEMNKGQDFGRKKAVAWYGIWNLLQLWSDSANAGEAKVVHVTSS